MNHASLFSGIGGFDLAAEWMGWTNVFNCEIDPFCQKVLKYHFSDAIQYDDIKQTDFTIWRGRVDILTGGFPCQPFSMAGKRRGTEDDRHLWPEMLRAIREIKPRWVVGENVFGFVNWNGGMVFREVISDLENEGYEVQPFIIPACAVNAPHRRDRVWIVAHNNSIGQTRYADKIGGGGNTIDRLRDFSIQTTQRRDDIRGECERSSQNGTPADTEHDGLTTHETKGKHIKIQCKKQTGEELCDNESSGEDGIRGNVRGNVCDEKRDAPDTECVRYTREKHREKESGQYTKANKGNGWTDFPTQPPLRSRDDGFPGGLDGITFPKLRNESIKAYGNAIVPQVVYEIFKVIDKIEIMASGVAECKRGKKG